MRTAEEKSLRELLAKTHTHIELPGWSYMYYDDGELQCGICGCDFLKDSALVLNQKIRAHALKLYESRSRLTE